MSISDTEAAWLAGALDGDGAICLRTRKPLAPQPARAVLTFVNTHLPTVNRIVDLVHRAVGTRPSVWVQEARGCRRERYNVSVSARATVQSLLDRCLPWLVVKYETAQLALRLLAEPPGPLPAWAAEAITKQRQAIRHSEAPGVSLNREPVATDFAYLAGLIDAEGCFSARFRPACCTRFEMRMTNRPAIERAAELIEAVVGHPIRVRRYELRPPRRPIFRITITRRSDLLRFIPSVYPYLYTKSTQAALLHAIAELPTQYRGPGRRAEYPDWLTAAVFALSAQKHQTFNDSPSVTSKEPAT